MDGPVKYGIMAIALVVTLYQGSQFWDFVSRGRDYDALQTFKLSAGKNPALTQALTRKATAICSEKVFDLKIPEFYSDLYGDAYFHAFLGTNKKEAVHLLFEKIEASSDQIFNESDSDMRAAHEFRGHFLSKDHSYPFFTCLMRQVNDWSASLPVASEAPSSP